MHYIEDVFMLASNHYADLITKGFQLFCKNSIVFSHLVSICDHHHVKSILTMVWRDIKNV